MGKKKADYGYVRKYFSYDGRTYEVCGATEEEALEKKLKKLRQLEAGLVRSDSTVERWAGVWYAAYVEHRKITAKSKAMYKGLLDREIVPAIGKVKLSKVTPLRLQQLLNAHAGESSSGVGKLRMVLKALFKRAYLSRLIPFDPSEGLELPETSSSGHRSLTASERAALIAVASLPDYHGRPNRSGCWLMLMLRCGLRPGETAALRKANVDLAGRTVHVVAAQESGSRREKGPKTSAGGLAVPPGAAAVSR